MMTTFRQVRLSVATEPLPVAPKLELPPVGPLAHRSLPEAVMAELRRFIVNGHLPAGTRLIETELAEQLQVSRATLRQAVRHLAFEGLVDVRPRRGVFVARMSTEVALEVCQARGVLEGCMARSACLVLATERIQDMRVFARRMGDAGRQGDVTGVAKLDIEFHTMVCDNQPNRRMAELWATLNAQNTAVLASRLAFHRYDWDDLVNFHLSLCDTLAMRDPDTAEKAVRDHYVGAAWDRERLT
jgi:DNA-binding GntR family transcriptional regulator